MSRPLILDAFCCAGGGAVGYHRAGFEVVGVDINPQPDYPFTFHQGDAISFIAEHGHMFDLIHASPPCQGEGAIAKGNQRELAFKHPRLIVPTRAVLNHVGKPYVIENVAGAEIRKDLRLCGEMYDLGVIMHRFFELSGWTARQPEHKPHRGRVRGWRHGQYFDGPYVAAYGEGGGKASVAEIQEAKGIDWISDHLALREALPPVYTKYLGGQFLARQHRATETRISA